jgi:uncharacterized membrane protein
MRGQVHQRVAEVAWVAVGLVEVSAQVAVVGIQVVGAEPAIVS